MFSAKLLGVVDVVVIVVDGDVGNWKDDKIEGGFVADGTMCREIIESSYLSRTLSG